MAAFGHFDLPPDFLASLTSSGAARGTFTAAAEAVAAGRAPQFVSGSGNHPQGGGRLGGEDEDEGGGLAEGFVGLSLGGGSSPLQQQPRQQNQTQMQTQPRGTPPIPVFTIIRRPDNIHHHQQHNLSKTLHSDRHRPPGPHALQSPRR